MRICPVCINAHCEPGVATCPDCAVAHTYARGGPIPPPRSAVAAPDAAMLAMLRAHDAALDAEDG
ncbi:MAG: hypothetical protein ACLP3C_15620 [Mycobacterium sp.]|uniref:hypothetical protein n=1 Tax=Mycobacterium sp. TaxID=1785 RepID=UPI003F994FE9